MKSSLLFQYALSRFLRFVAAAEILILAALCLSIFSRMPAASTIFSSTNQATPSDSTKSAEKRSSEAIVYSRNMFNSEPLEYFAIGRIPVI